MKPHVCRPFDSVLVANRGEIACRILRSVRARGLRGIAVYSDADAGTLHTRLADVALRIGPAAASESYLSIPALIAAAQASGAQAVHPGYGFLSENAAFAEACEAAGLVFIGPPAAAMRTMGDKALAKQRMTEVGVPVLADYRGEAQDVDTLSAAALRLGFPLLLKPRLGGGGKGMRVVEREADLEAALLASRREALAAFGDAALLLEPWVPRARHVEVQVFADAHGHCVHLFERDCSLQRRHQKLVEEAPAPALADSVTTAMRVAALKAARAVDYLGAGTVEFLLEPGGRFHFMEMNTRLQVEHPVTEMITGIDLVDWQLRVAAGEALPLEQDAIRLSGHAIEARLYAEDPERGFLPASGRIAHLHFAAGEGLRVECGLQTGDTVGTDYDPLLAKLVAWGPTRDEALVRLRQAIAAARLQGLRHNLAFLHRLLHLTDFVAAGVDTGAIARCEAHLLAAPPAPPAEIFACASLAWLLRERAAAEPSPWGARDGWRLQGRAARRLAWRAESGADVLLHATSEGTGYVLACGEHRWRAHGELAPDGQLLARLDDTQWQAHVLVSAGDGPTLATLALCLPSGRPDTAFPQYRLQLLDPFAPREREEHGQHALQAPMPGRVLALPVSEGATVAAGAVLAVMEAMKMEHAIRAPAAGVLRTYRVRVGEAVPEGTLLGDFEPLP